VAEIGPFQAFYDGSLQHPWLLWAAATGALGVVLARPRVPPDVRAYCVGLAALSLVDAWLTSNFVYGIGRFEGALASAVPLFFVLAGDFRFLLVATAGQPDGSLRFSGRALAQAAALVVIVPIGSQLAVAALPDALQGSRTLFLVYEVSFALLTCLLLARHANVRAVPWVRGVAKFVIGYYVLWATADVAILTLGDAGYLLRVLPNVLYYGGLIGAIGWLASTAASSEGASTARDETK
jgi:hypothetical protein